MLLVQVAPEAEVEHVHGEDEVDSVLVPLLGVQLVLGPRGRGVGLDLHGLVDALGGLLDGVWVEGDVNRVVEDELGALEDLCGRGWGLGGARVEAHGFAHEVEEVVVYVVVFHGGLLRGRVCVCVCVEGRRSEVWRSEEGGRIEG